MAKKFVFLPTVALIELAEVSIPSLILLSRK
jgi:hypothetical protein